MELIDNIDGMITSLDHCPEFEKNELIMDSKTENETLKGLVQEYKKRSNEISFSGTSKDVETSVKGVTNILSKSIQKFNLWKNWKRKDWFSINLKHWKV